MFGTNKVKCQMWGGGVDLPPMEGGLDAPGRTWLSNCAVTYGAGSTDRY